MAHSFVQISKLTKGNTFHVTCNFESTQMESIEIVLNNHVPKLKRNGLLNMLTRKMSQMNDSQKLLYFRRFSRRPKFPHAMSLVIAEAG